MLSAHQEKGMYTYPSTIIYMNKINMFKIPKFKTYNNKFIKIYI